MPGVKWIYETFDKTHTLPDNMLEMTRIGKILSDDFPHARIALYNVCFGDGPEVKKATIDELVNEGSESLLRLAGKIDTERMNAPSFMMVLVGVGTYAYRREDGVYVVPIGCLKD